MRKALFILVGIAALIFGIFGIVLPILPTTPFLLLALYCFTRGSEKLSIWFQDTLLYKKYLSEYVQTKSLTLKQKLLIQISSGMIMAVAFIIFESLVVKIIIGFCFVVHNLVFIFIIKTRYAINSTKKC